MKKLYIVANWKANKTSLESKQWIQEIANGKWLASLRGRSGQMANGEEKEVIVCPGFQLLSTVKALIEENSLPFKIGAQDVSAFGIGANTGEVAAEQLKEFVEYSIVGHSERRKYFHESDEVVSGKLVQAVSADLIPILCVSSIDQVQNSKVPTSPRLRGASKIQNHSSKLKSGKIIIAYEPLFAIGSGTPDSSENADRKAIEIKRLLGDASVIYGGSVTSENVNQFTSKPNIDGVLVGGASLDAEKFLGIIKNA